MCQGPPPRASSSHPSPDTTRPLMAGHRCQGGREGGSILHVSTQCGLLVRFPALCESRYDPVPALKAFAGLDRKMGAYLKPRGGQ